MKRQLPFFFFLIALTSTAQTGTFIDKRDQQVYSTIVINDKTWFRENLRFQTPKSFCPHFNKDSADCKDGNYYSNSELNSICPEGWHVATIAEWESFLRVLFKKNDIRGGVLIYDTARIEKNFGLQLPKDVIFTDTLLKLVRTGWVEGVFLKKNEALTVWAIDTETRDDKYHFHFGNTMLTKHAHDHHIIDKPRKVRKFPVRCVCETTR